jgi:hypothetical protein
MCKGCIVVFPPPMTSEYEESDEIQERTNIQALSLIDFADWSGPPLSANV